MVYMIILYIYHKAMVYIITLHMPLIFIRKREIQKLLVAFASSFLGNLTRKL